MLSAAAFVAKIEKSGPEQTKRLCQVMKAKGTKAAFANFKKGYVLVFLAENKNVPPKRVFGQIAKHC